MTLMTHGLAMFYRIIKKRRPGGYRLPFGYLKTIVKAQSYHKLNRHSETQPVAFFQIELMGMRISFFNYATLLHLFEEIFIREIYFFKSTSASPIIFDCGSHIGLSILYFKSEIPSCQILGFEPDRD